MAKTGVMHKLRALAIKALILLVVLAAVFFMGAHMGKQESVTPVETDSAPVITGDLLGQQLRTVQELITVEYHYTNMGKFENQADFYGWKVPFTSKSFIVSYDGVIRAGVDLSEVQPEVDDLDHIITITLPKSEIISHEIPEDSIEVFDETHNIFNQITIKDYTDFTKDQKEVVTQKAIDNGLLTAADETARESVESFLTLIPGMDEYTLIIN